VSRTIDTILASAATLKPFPKVAVRALELLEDPLVSAGRLVEVLALDATLTATMLKAANSAAVRRSRHVDDLKQALAMLGNQRFRELVFASASVEYLSGNQDGYQLTTGDLWRHSVATSLMVEILRQAAGLPANPALFTAALLHDLGKAVLSSYVEAEGKTILALVAQGQTFLDAERVVLGVDHAELGALIVERWNFSPELASLIRYHHTPEARATSKPLAVLHVANVLSQLYGMGPGVDALAQRTTDAPVELLGLTRRQLEASLAELHEKLTQADTLLEMA
jgi:putative nucleotidyltransferase with HDIG domain